MLGPLRIVCRSTLAAVLGEESLLGKEQDEGTDVFSFLTQVSVHLQVSHDTLL